MKRCCYENPQSYKKQYQILLSLRKKAISLTEVFSDEVINFTNERSM